MRGEASPDTQLSIHTPRAKVTLQLDPRINLALQQNDVPVVKAIAVENTGDGELRDVTIHLEGDPAFALPYQARVQVIGPRQSWLLDDVDLLLSPIFLVALTERAAGLLRCRVTAGEAEVCATSERVELLAYDEWSGHRSLPEILAAFVLPNHPSVEQVLAQSQQLLRQSQRPDALNGYQSGSRAFVLERIGAIYEALRRQQIGYINPPASFEQTGQKIRTPDRVLGTKLGTCLDLTTLVAACLEQAGLHPLLVMIKGHAFVGCWVEEQVFPTATTDDCLALRKRVDLDELVVFETTTLTGNRSADFSAAVKAGRQHLEDEDRFLYVVDVARARRGRIRPIAGRVSDQGRFEPMPLERPAAHEALPAVPKISEARPAVESATESPASRLDNWRRRLLDLSLRNRLLNFRPTKKTVPLLCPELSRFEDQLASGGRFQVLPRPADLNAADPRSEAKVRRRVSDDATREVLVRALESARVHADLEAEPLDRQMTEIYRAARLAQEESGTSALYVAVGFLSWLPAESRDEPRLAPILLVPVEITRASIQQGFRLSLGDDEPRINVTLLQMLEKDFSLVIPGLDPLPRDESGIDVSGVLETFRRAVIDIEGWDVRDECHLGFFSFTKFLMWRDLQANAGKLLESSVVRHLVHSRSEAFEPGAPMPRVERLDVDHPPETVFCPLSADSSQLQAVLAAANGRSFVLHGPPGTGKSQTIANVIAQCFAQQKTVLFVAEKMVALDVVHKRLRDAGLGDFCLELHSNKAKKVDVIKQLGEALDRGALKVPDTWQSETARLAKLRGELNEYVDALHAPRYSGESAFRGIASVIRWHDAPDVELRWSSPDAITAGKLAQLRELVDRMSTYAQACGALQGHPWNFVRQLYWSPDWQRDVESGLARLATAAHAAQEHARDVSALLGLGGPAEAATSLAVLSRSAHALQNPPAVPVRFLLEMDWESLRGRVATWIEHGLRRDSLRARVCSVFREAIFSLDVASLAAAAQRAARTWAPFAWLKLWLLGRKIRPMLQPGATVTHAELHPRLDEAAELQREQSVLDRSGDEARSALGRHWNDAEAQWDALGEASTWSTRVRAIALEVCGHDLAQAAALRERLGQLVVEGRAQLTSGGALALRLERFEAAFQAFRDASNALAAALDIPGEALFAEDGSVTALQSLQTRLPRLRMAAPELRRWCQWQAVRAEALSAGLAPLVEALEQGGVHSGDARAAFEKGYYRYWASAVVSADPRLSAFHSAEHEKKIATFREVDDRQRKLAVGTLRARLSSRVQIDPAVASKTSEVGIVRKEAQKKRNHMPVRALLERSGNLITRLKPCFLMSPMSIAQYLDPAFPKFDVVIFDEASQIPVWDAVGAMARANAAIVVGDPKQLPPTSFFGRGDDDESDSTGDVDLEDLESVLDDCLAAGLQPLHLRWHYRSRHESLIAFSNRYYYDNRLFTFPSADTHDAVGAGVSFRHVADGVYDKGKSRTNEREARALVRDVVERLHAAKGACSVGVVTFNLTQCTLIQDLLDQARREHPEIESSFAEDAPERVFVKNLENVQGDERDVIYFSIGFGKDLAGKMSMNFGPMNRDGGERRLNVAVTRARESVVVYSSIRAEDIDLNRTQARGVRDLKAFLDYAERGARAMVEATLHAVDDDFGSPFEQQVCERLRQAGWQVHTQVGCSGYRIDLAVIDPERPGRYLLGIECDGATYHRAANARDRDKLRAAVLTGLGWRLHRVWSTDWWQQSELELEKIVRALEVARREVESGIVRPAVLALPEAIHETVAEQVAEPVRPVSRETQIDRGYRAYVAKGLLGQVEDFYEPGAAADIRRILNDIVDKEGPVSFLLAARRAMQHWGMQRVTTRAAERFRTYLDVNRVRVVERSGTFLWPATLDPNRYDAFRIMTSAPASQRDAAEIAIEEIANAAMYVLGSSVSSPEEDLVRDTARVLGFQRTGQKVQQRMAEGIAYAVESGRARRSGAHVIVCNVPTGA